MLSVLLLKRGWGGGGGREKKEKTAATRGVVLCANCSNNESLINVSSFVNFSDGETCLFPTIKGILWQLFFTLEGIIVFIVSNVAELNFVHLIFSEYARS